MPSSSSHADVVVIGAGAAGLMTAVWTGRTSPGRSIVVLDGARKIGAKILVSGGGRCNVTHHQVDERAFAGSTRPAIRKVLDRFGVEETIEFFRELGVELKREETGKLFPVTDRADDVLRALVRAAAAAGARVEHPRRVTSVARDPDGGFVCRGEWGEYRCAHLVLATGGMSLPKTGSDGAGYRFAQAFGHTTTERIFPSLVPLVLDERSFVRALSGVACDATVHVRSARGARIIDFTGPVLCTHFGLSGPAILDASRWWLDANAEDPGARVVLNWLPDESFETLDRDLLDAGARGAGRLLAERGIPKRLAEALCAEAGVDPGAPMRTLERDARRRLVHQVVECAMPVTGDRGFTFAEVTAGGVPLAEVRLQTMESRLAPGLYLVGEICDVDGRIGGFNFQWAWASGFVAGTSIGGR